ncbi:site-specific integrase [Cupriavidus sp. AcVe19-6a]|uniref:site-specific integrase n=1 Tax=Cupriavidus sp. AcVe19-6a TaxID=2821358 RepID=UPI001AE6ED1D|nr:site-specific integrase [Cupriavidus sp. AcVe19-6a]MBP0639669.1 tyrosine-type recombinase/integrase [Cupriavidus sp. AcVe19-6a]
MPKYSRITSGQIRSEEWFAETSLGAYADAFARYLTDRGYAEASVSRYFRSVAHFAHWLSQEGASLGGINEALINQFLDRHLPHCRCAPRCSRTRTDARAALRHFLAMLMASGTRTQRMPIAPAAVATELAAFNRHLLEVRGLSDSTCTVRLWHVRDFLVDRFGAGPIRVSTLAPIDVARFVTRYTRGWTPGSIKTVGISLRGYFLFKASRGLSTKNLIAALPRVAHWRLAGLPEILSAIEIQQLLNAFDRKTATGKRDYAITRCLLDLGLRRVEVAHLQLNDVDWRAGTLNIHAKGKRVDTLPLPRSTGQAIADYLRHGRPTTTRRELFVRHRPPINAPASLDIVRNAVRYAAKRCNLQQRIRGTHIFRRTAACRMVQGGAPFKEIADLLRHRDLDTTTIYAKVDLPSLRRVALPWPGR